MTRPEESAPARRPGLRKLCLIAIVLLYVVSVPWYRELDAPLVLWFGMPDWVALALGCYVAVAFLNALAWSWTDVRDDSPFAGEHEDQAGSSRAERRR